VKVWKIKNLAQRLRLYSSTGEEVRFKSAQDFVSIAQMQRR
jgi:hypothetical protein